MKNKIIVNFSLEEDCSQEEGEVSIMWQPINFMIYSTVFHEIIDISIADYLSDNLIEHWAAYEVIFQHIVEHDGAGAVTSEYFEPIHSEISHF
tara:strand:- start:358 stop:636 length:279 start_codon:yes stop_codon:yes gene_type:complete